jgi:hypothetical protein
MANFKGRKWTIKRQGPMKHSIGGKKLYYVYFQGKFEIDEIRAFAQKKSNDIKRDGKIKFIQVAVVYDKERDRSGKITKVGEPVDVRNLSNSYDYDVGDITGFYIYF